MSDQYLGVGGRIVTVDGKAVRMPQGSGDMQSSVYDPNNKHQDIFAYVDNAIKDVKVTTDATPTQGSTNPVQSGGVYSALNNKLDKTGNGSNVTVTFSTLDKLNLVSGDSLSRLMGKISAWLKDLGKLAFKNTVDKSDLASDVQTSLGKADSALQSYTETDPTVPAWAKAETKPSYTASEVGALPDTTVIPTVPVTTNILKGDGSGGLVAATRGSDYIASGNITKQTLVNVETDPTENYAINWVYG